MRVLTNGEVVERSIDDYGGLPIEVLPPVHPTPVDVPNNSRFHRFRLPSEMDEGDDHRHSRLSTMEAWLADFKARTHEDLPVNHLRGYRGFMSRNSFHKWTRTSSEPPLPTRNKLEAKCHKYLLKVPKARSAQMMDGGRPNHLHNDVCERLQVEINAMSRRLIRQGLIVKKVREAERDGFDPRESTRGIKRDPQSKGDMRSPKRLCTEYRSLLVEWNPFTSPVKDRFLVLNNLQ
ncbi:hypothetical protein RHMOL_Rhmol09G0112700 [Rhododendron molle]|uniref:Uncharacterized protein n=1 Tax=Rhododendron molle TaxID=49168 RepID=A0ACC0MDV8_RHOML|nr:hypothetical protein RHMOL_Rhmol09G0112700 [Rhododendron molle]